jgi:hypothetical protein
MRWSTHWLSAYLQAPAKARTRTSVSSRESRPRKDLVAIFVIGWTWITRYVQCAIILVVSVLANQFIGRRLRLAALRYALRHKDG